MMKLCFRRFSVQLKESTSNVTKNLAFADPVWKHAAVELSSCLEGSRKALPHDFVVHIRNSNSLYFLQQQHPLAASWGEKSYQKQFIPAAPCVQAAALPTAKNFIHERRKITGVKLVNAISADALEWREQRLNLDQLPRIYLQLSKFRLTGLVVLTEMAGYAIAPGLFIPERFAAAALGTALTSCSANTINQFLEVPYDSQMSRTKQRPLVRKLISPLHAVMFGVGTGACGVAVLALAVNPLTAALGLANLLLYTAIYTPIKRLTIANTWIGSLVGAVPPVMGWTACTGTLDAGGFVLATVLFCWQFPHFNALSWNLKGEYSRAGYRMMAVTKPELCRRTSLTYSVALACCCCVAPLTGVTTWTFAADSIPLNACLVYLSWRFYHDSNSKSSRNLFRFSLVHLPALLMLMLISKTTGETDQAQQDNSEVSANYAHSTTTHCADPHGNVEIAQRLQNNALIAES